MHIRKTAVLVFSMFLLMFSIPVSADQAIVITDNLNVRTGPGTNFDKIDQIHTGEMYEIVQQKDNWIEIELGNNTGWVTTEFVDIKTSSTNSETDTDSSRSTDSPKTVTIQHDNTHLRKEPSTTSEIIGFAEKGSEFDVLTENGDWYEIKNDNLTGFIYKSFLEKSDNPASGLQNKTIVIDAGHGGRDVGAIGASGTFEKDFTFKTMQQLKQELTSLGAKVILTRKDDEFISLASRTSLTNIQDTDAFISIHYNSVPSMPGVTGIGAYYYHEQNQKLAQYIIEDIAKITGARNRGIKFGDFHVIRQNFKHSILLELGFISNYEKEQLLLTNAYQKQLVKGIVNGLNKYFYEQ
ncbi:N-acetylmuramoyl-L-alanine amidase [Virgibacillus kekensis]|uniref:N-acetylmuramoyl-L-alanine amidase n=1 Tax=Virgibacillus kekensis TaxID=202261 RepID=A0ABV9DM61_9BACI